MSRKWSRGGAYHVPVIVHGEARAEQAGERPGHRRAFQHIPEHPELGVYVVARAGSLLPHRLRLRMKLVVEGLRQLGHRDGQDAVDQELPVHTTTATIRVQFLNCRRRGKPFDRQAWAIIGARTERARRTAVGEC